MEEVEVSFDLFGLFIFLLYLILENIWFFKMIALDQLID